MQTYQSVFLVLSNLFIIPLIIWCIITNNLLDSTVFILLFTGSSLYHMCLAGWWCPSTLYESQYTDHFIVYFMMLWVYLSLWNIDVVVRFCGSIIFIFLLSLFSVNSTSTWVFACSLVWFFILFAVFRLVLFYYNEKILNMDFLLTVIAIGFFAAGLTLHVIAGNPTSSTIYWWSHSVWHIFAMLGLLCLVLARDGVRITKTIKYVISFKYL